MITFRVTAIIGQNSSCSMNLFLSFMPITIKIVQKCASVDDADVYELLNESDKYFA